jgi:type IV pilus assembly protein PilM
VSSFASILKDPPPAYAFELSEDGIAFVKTAVPEQPGFQPFDGPFLSISPVHDNVQNVDGLKATIDKIVPQDRKKRRAALILPDYCSRVAVLDFDSFPTGTEEQLALVRFRMKKSVPFDVDTAVVSYYAQPRLGKSKIDVVVAIMAREIVTRYEAPFRGLAMQPGFITTSSLAMLNLVQPDGLTIVAKLGGRTVSAMVLDGSTLKLSRCIEMESSTRDEIESVLHPTFVYVEDELNTKPTRLLMCGFGADSQDLARDWQAQWSVTVEPLRSRLGTLSQHNAGLMGYLESPQG